MVNLTRKNKLEWLALNKNDNNKKATKYKDLIKKYEGIKKVPFDKKKEMYLEQIDRNYKEGDRNWW